VRRRGDEEGLAMVSFSDKYGTTSNIAVRGHGPTW